MTDQPPPEQPAEPEQGPQRLQLPPTMLTQPSYRWVCPRCGTPKVSGAPIYEPACGTCNYPEPPPPGWKGVVDPDMEATEIARLAAAAAANPEDEAAAAAAAAAAAPETPNEAQGLPSEPLVHDDPVVEVEAGPVKLDRGWLAVVMADQIGRYLNGLNSDLRTGDATALDWFGAAEAVADAYEGERWRLLCGCLAGEHGESVDEMRAAHPDRRL